MRTWSLLLLVGCGVHTGDDETDGPAVSGCEVGPEPAAVVGKGEFEWQDSDADEGKTQLIHGAQGGFHTFVSVRADHLSIADRWKVMLTGRADGEVLAMATLERTPECREDVDTNESIGTWLIWRAQPEDLHDLTVQIEAEVTDVDGRSAIATGIQVIWDEELAGQ